MAVTLFLLVLAGPSQDAEARIRESLGTLEKALAGQDESLGDLFDLSRLVGEMERSGALSDADGGFRYRSVRRLEQHLGGMAMAPGTLKGGWQKIQPLTIRVNTAGDEAESLCRVTIGGRKHKFRVWMIREGASWKVFDLENLDGSFRLSVIGLQHTPGVRDEEERYALRDGVMTLQRGAMHLAEGKPEAAREAMAMARQAAPPQAVEAWIDFVDGRALLALEEPQAALKAADRALGRQKELALAHRLKAECHAALDEFEPAIAAAQEFLRRVGDEAGAWTLIGGAYERLDQPEKAVEAYRKGAASDDEDWRSRSELGRLLVERHRAAEAGPFLMSAARLAPADEGLFERAADLLDIEGAPAIALEIAEDAAVRRKDDPAVLFRRGRALRQLGRFPAAEAALRSAGDADPKDPEIRAELVMALAQAGKDAEAREQMSAPFPMSEWYVQYVRAFVHAAAGRPAEALEELKPVLREDWNLKHILAWIEREPVFERLRRTKEAGVLLEPARATRDYWKARENPKLPPEEMLRIAEKRIQAVPTHGLAYYDQGCVLRQMKRYPEAERALRKAIDLSVEKELFQDALGRTLAAQGKLEEALAVADFLLKSKPRAEQFGLDLRVAVYELAGKRDQALQALRELLEKHPDWFPAVTTGKEFDGFRALPAAQEIIRRARARTKK